MADVTRGLSDHHLVNVAQWHVSEDNYASGRVASVEAHRGNCPLQEAVLSVIQPETLDHFRVR